MNVKEVYLLLYSLAVRTISLSPLICVIVVNFYIDQHYVYIENILTSGVKKMLFCRFSVCLEISEL